MKKVQIKPIYYYIIQIKEVFMNKRKKLTELTFTSLMTVIIVISAQLVIPAAVPFTMQTFGVLLSLFILGGKKGTAAILVYIMLGAVGVPVFSGFGGGLGVLLGSTGGYIFGFLGMGLIYWAITSILGKKRVIKIIAAAVGLIVCYTLGTAWFMLAYMKKGNTISFGNALKFAVLPFIIPDFIKLTAAIFLSSRLERVVKNKGKT